MQTFVAHSTRSENWPVKPKVKEVPYFLNMQATVLLDDFTPDNGGTAVVPGSQVEAVYPWDMEQFKRKMIQPRG